MSALGMTRFVICLALTATAAATHAQSAGDASHFVWAPSRDAGAAALRPPHGGDYIYSATDPLDGRVEQRFLIGKPVRTEFVLFSADEEAALWHLRDRQLHPEAYIYRAPRRRAVTPVSAPRPLIAWPRVVLREGNTCVPQLAFAGALDWTEHLVCWIATTREVRHD